MVKRTPLQEASSDPAGSSGAAVQTVTHAAYGEKWTEAMGLCRDSDKGTSIVGNRRRGHWRIENAVVCAFFKLIKLVQVGMVSGSP